MEFGEIAIVALLVVGYSIVSGRLDRSPVTAPMVFCFSGLLLGTDVLGVVDVHIEDATVGLLAEATLVLVLFSDAARIDMRALRTESAIPVRLLGIGFPLTVSAGLGIALVVFPELSVWEAGLLAIILTPTDAALGQAVVSSKVVPVRIRQALNVESGLNDGIAVPVLAVMLAGAAAEGDGDTAFWTQFIGEQVGFGIAVGLVVGLVGGYLVEEMHDRGWMNHAYGQIAPLSLAVLAFAGAEAVDGNGFMAAFIAGMAFGTRSNMVERVVEFAEEEGQLLAALSFFLFGAVVAGPAFDGLDWTVVLYAVLSLTAIRMIPVGLSMVGSGVRPQTVGFLAWFGPRGLASIIFAIEVAEAGDVIAGAETISSVVTCTVLLSIVAHGVSAVPVSRRYGAWVADMPELAPEMLEVTDMATRCRPID